MSRGRFLLFLTVGLSMVMLGVFTISAIAADLPRITKEELKSVLGNPDVVILDVRTGKSQRKIKGAVWEDPRNVGSWADKYPRDKTLVLY